MLPIGQNACACRRAARLALTAALTVALAAACASASTGSPDGGEGEPKRAPMYLHGPRAGPPGNQGGAPAGAMASYLRRSAVFHRWGLAAPTEPAPAPPAIKLRPATQSPRHGDEKLVPVIHRVPTEDRVVFLTIDDGVAKDREFTAMLRELNVPVSSFLTHDEAGDDYGYFRELQRLGNAIQNHTVSHPNLRRLTYDEQRSEICEQQRTLEHEFGVRPRLFRPPYGNHDRDTLRAARACGIQYVVLWALEAGAKSVEWPAGKRRLCPGDIILTHFRGPSQWGGTMTDMLRRVLRTIAGQGFAVARLEDYL